MKTINISCEFCQKSIEKSIYEVTRSKKLGNPMYCSLSCGAKHSAQKRGLKNWNITEYSKNPTKCKSCGNDIPYKQKRNRFCTQSCAAKFNNSFKIINSKRSSIKISKLKYCSLCGKICNFTKAKYCSLDCQRKYRKNELFGKIESGDTTLYVKNYKKYLIEKRGAKCEECGWNKKNVKTNVVPIELDHIDGNHENNSLTNLKLLCPNCHSLTPTYKALNKGNGRHDRMKRYNDNKSY